MGISNSCKTFVSNGCVKPVYAKVETDKRFEVKTTTSAEAQIREVAGLGGKKSNVFNWQLAEQEGYTLIESGQYLVFSPHSSNKTVYITVKFDLNKPDCIVKKFQVKSSRGIIINKAGYIRNAKKGSKWIDESGEDHFLDAETREKLIQESKEDEAVDNKYPTEKAKKKKKKKRKMVNESDSDHSLDARLTRELFLESKEDEAVDNEYPTYRGGKKANEDTISVKSETYMTKQNIKFQHSRDLLIPGIFNND